MFKTVKVVRLVLLNLKGANTLAYFVPTVSDEDKKFNNTGCCFSVGKENIGLRFRSRCLHEQNWILSSSHYDESRSDSRHVYTHDFEVRFCRAF